MTRLMTRLGLALLCAVAMLEHPGSAQTMKTTTRMVYHNGPVMRGSTNLYLIWYGCWSAACPGAGGADAVAALDLVPHFASALGSSPYFSINTGYPDSSGGAPSGGLVHVGSVVDSFSHGSTLTEADLGGIVQGQIASGAFPLDTRGIYVVLTSADVTVEDGDTKFCISCCHLHGTTEFEGAFAKYVFVGNPRRCPSSCARQFAGDQTPNGNLAADGMVTWLAHALNQTVTNPHNTGWFDRYGLENADKCEGLFGETYTVPWNGSVANVRLAARDFLLHQNWVNGRKGRCALRP